MNTLLKYDKVVLTKELNERFRKVGDAFEIANILEDSFVLRDAKSKVAIGIVSFDDFERCFVKEESFKGWTKWTPLTGVDGQTDAMYRTNRKKVQVKFLTDKVRAEACCHEEDEFNLYFGVQTAYLRCRNKALKNKKAEYKRLLKDIDYEIAENNIVVRNMINSLDK